MGFALKMLDSTLRRNCQKLDWKGSANSEPHRACCEAHAHGLKKMDWEQPEERSVGLEAFGERRRGRPDLGSTSLGLGLGSTSPGL